MLFLEEIWSRNFTNLFIAPMRISEIITSLIITALLSAYGRAISEVGAVMIVGGNIDHYTRVMTTAISLETRMGNLEYAMALGLVLISITFFIYSFVYILNKKN